MIRKTVIALAAAAALSAGVGAASAQQPGTSDVDRVKAGSYVADPNHTQVAWSVDHMGFSTLFGLFGQITGTLEIDPKKPAEARLAVEIPMSGVAVTAEKFRTHLLSNEILDAQKFPTATFKSTSIEIREKKARIVGDLTLHGVTKPVVMIASFHGGGVNPMTKAETIGFSAASKVKRSDFGLGFATPVVSDDVDLTIVGAFEKK